MLGTATEEAALNRVHVILGVISVILDIDHFYTMEHAGPENHVHRSSGYAYVLHAVLRRASARQGSAAI